MPKVLALMAHPDDIEITCAGTLALLRNAGWQVHMATMTAGDLGSSTLPREEISRVRLGEARASAAIMGATYSCLGFDDLGIVYDVPSKRRVSLLLREVRPDALIIPSPVDYMADHEETARLAREATFASTVPNWHTAGNGAVPPPCDHLPVILYADAIGNVDHLGRRLPTSRVVDVTDQMDLKERMLASHESQRAWLRVQHGKDDYLGWMRRCGRDRARDFDRLGVDYAEGFTQHLGHGFPHEDILTLALGSTRVKSVALDRAAAPLEAIDHDGFAANGAGVTS